MPSRLLINSSPSTMEYTVRLQKKIENGPYKFFTGLLPWILTFNETENEMTLLCVPKYENAKWKIEIVYRIQISSDFDFEGDYSFVQSPEIPAKSLKIPYAMPDDDCLIIELSIRNLTGLRTCLAKSFLITEPSDIANCVVTVEDEKFFVNLDMLSMYSSLFNEIRQTEIAEMKKTNSLKIDLKTYVSEVGKKDFRSILEFIMYKKDPIKDKNLHSIAKCANILKFHIILKRIEQYLLDKAGADPWKLMFQYLQLASLYDFTQLQHELYEVLHGSNKETDPEFYSIITSQDYDIPYLSRTCVAVFQNTTNSMKALIDWTISSTVKQPNENENVIFIVIHPETMLYYLVNNWKIEAKATLSWKDKEATTTLVFNSDTFKGEISLACDDVKPESLTDVTLTFTVLTACGIRYYGLLYDDNTFHVRDKTTTVILRLDDGDLYSNLQYLACWSDYFKAQSIRVEELEIDNGLPVIQMKDIEMDVFLLILLHIYPTQYTLTESEIRLVVPVADRLLFYKILIFCEQNMDGKSLKDVQLAVDYRMDTVLKKFKNNYNTYSSLQSVMTLDPDGYSISDNCKLILYNLNLDILRGC